MRQDRGQYHFPIANSDLILSTKRDFVKRNAFDRVIKKITPSVKRPFHIGSAHVMCIGGALLIAHFMRPARKTAAGICNFLYASLLEINNSFLRKPLCYTVVDRRNITPIFKLVIFKLLVMMIYNIF